MATQPATNLKDTSTTTPVDFRVVRNPSGKIDRTLDWLSGLLSPILIKEARQAIKSRQLAITLTLLFLAVLVWSITCAVNARVGATSEAEQSSVTILGFALSLALPLFVVVPFWAFSSMSNEIDEATYDLVLCTTLQPWQIVAGKFSAAAAQMLIYLAVVAPCFAFCSVLPGTNLPALVFVLAGYASFGLGLSALGLLMGTPKNQVWRVFSMVLFFALLLFCFAWAYSLTYSYFDNTSSVDYQNWDDIEWSAYIGGLFAVVAGPIGLGILFGSMAVGAVSPHSSNRSTPVRIAGCICWLIIAILLILTSFFNPDGEWFVSQCMMAGVFVLLVGGWLLGEQATLSRRVRRQLPTSTWVDMLVCWLMPGPGRGFVFAMLLYAGFLMLHPLTSMLLHYTGMNETITRPEFGFYGSNFGNFTPDDYPWLFIVSMVSIAFVYVGVYLSVVWLIIAAFARLNVRVNSVGSLCITVGVVLGSILGWLFIDGIFSTPSAELELIDQLNGAWVMVWWIQNYDRNTIDFGLYMRVMFFPGIATVLAFVCAARELNTSRLATPDAVVADDMANQPAKPGEVSFDDIE